MVRSYRFEMKLHPYYEKPLKWERNELKRKNRHKQKITIYEFLKNEFDVICDEYVRGEDYFYCE